MTLRTYIDHAIRDGAAFDAVICGCDVQQTFCWQPDMCITDACEAEYRPLLDAEIRILAAAPGSGFPSSRSARTGSFSATPFRSARRATAARASTGGCSAPDKTSGSARPKASALGRAFLSPRSAFRARERPQCSGGARGGQGPPRIRSCGFSAAERRRKLLPRSVFRVRERPQSSGGARGGKARLESDLAVFQLLCS